MKLPNPMPNVIGHVATMFDHQRCEMMIFDLQNKTALTCRKNFIWSTRDISQFMSDDSVPLMAMDAMMFSPYAV